MRKSISSTTTSKMVSVPLLAKANKLIMMDTYIQSSRYSISNIASKIKQSDWST